jgi:hypothetical protein
VSREIEICYNDPEGNPLPPREVLAILGRSGTPLHWLDRRECDEAGRVAAAGTDEECATLLEKLEKEANHRLAMWRWSQ